MASVPGTHRHIEPYQTPATQLPQPELQVQRQITLEINKHTNPQQEMRVVMETTVPESLPYPLPKTKENEIGDIPRNIFTLAQINQSASQRPRYRNRIVPAKAGISNALTIGQRLRVPSGLSLPPLRVLIITPKMFLLPLVICSAILRCNNWLTGVVFVAVTM